MFEKMKKNNFLLIGIVIAVVILSVVITIIVMGKDDESSSGMNTSTGTNTINNGETSYSPSDLQKKITSSGAMTVAGDLVVFAKNSNDVTVDMEIEVEFYDSNKKLVGSSEKTLEAIGKNVEVAVEMYDTPKNFDNYKIYVDVDQTSSDYIVYYDKIKITHNNTGKEIVAQVKNNSEESISTTEVAVVYYQDKKVIGYSYGLEYDIKPGRAGNFSIDYPHDKEYDDINFDTYKVFVNQAYSYDW